MRLWTKTFGYLLAGTVPCVLLMGAGLATLEGWWLRVLAAAAALAVLLVGAKAATGHLNGALQGLAIQLEALRGGDFGRRMRVQSANDAFTAAAREANALGDQLRERRLEAVEATALLRTVMAEIDVALFAVDQAGTVRLANQAGARLLAQSSTELVGLTAQEVGLGPLIEGPAPRTLSAEFPGGAGRWELRRRCFRERGQRHQLILLAEVSRALREEERVAWQRLVRVLGHELNNSLTPIRSVAGSLVELLGDDPLPEDWQTDMKQGLGAIAARAAGLGRFMAGYARLAQLPPPLPRFVDVSAVVQRVAALETRVPVSVVDGPAVQLSADADQLEQALINLVKNAAEASLETGGAVEVSWLAGRAIEVVVQDQGLGLASDANLFVPFFTTKPGGSGIGLVLSRQIAESHGGTLTLSNRSDRSGCRAVLRLPRDTEASYS